METLTLRTDNPDLGYGDGQFTAFASDLGLRAGQFPADILLISHKTGRRIYFNRVPTPVWRPGSHIFYKPDASTRGKAERELSILLFND